MVSRIFKNVTLATCFFGSLHLLVPILMSLNYHWDFLTTSSDVANSESFDFIVVGGGSAGAVVANRLSKNSQVLLLEAGGDPIYPMSIPWNAGEMLHMPDFSWNYKSVPQTHSSQAMINKQSLWPRGKLLGGTSNINHVLYSRGNPLDYNHWANVTGSPRWKYENLLPYFKKSLNYRGKYKNNENHYGQSAYGYLGVETHSFTPLHDHFISAGKELGFNEIDLNGPQSVGFGISEVTTMHGSRHSTYEAFLKPFLHRRNLRISRYSEAYKIKLDKNNRAVGVFYKRHGVKRFAQVSKEIIVSAGAVNSPKLLMLSGIGPKSHLQSLNIKLRVDLPVGQNLKDHLGVPLMPITINKPLSLLPTRDLGLGAFIDYYFHGKGILTSPGTLQSQAFISSKYSLSKDWPDLQIYITSIGLSEQTPLNYAKEFGIEPETMKKFFGNFSNSDAIAFMVSLGKPKSVGEIKLKDKYPETKPLIDPKFLEEPQDVKIMIEGIKFCLKLLEETESFKNVNAKLTQAQFPGCEHFTQRSDQYWECYIRQISRSMFHPVGTCRMGKDKSDLKAVVNPDLRVLDTIGLRVADTSVMADIVNGNTNAPAILIGEMASEFIREYWSEQVQICNKFHYVFLSYSFPKCFYSRLF